MGEGSWEDRLHISFIGEHVLFPGLRLDSWGHFVGASLLTTIFCLCERCVVAGIMAHKCLTMDRCRLVTLALMRHWAPFRYVRRSRLRTALWRTVLYWIVTLLRLCVNYFLRGSFRSSYICQTVHAHIHDIPCRVSRYRYNIVRQH